VKRTVFTDSQQPAAECGYDITVIYNVMKH